MRDKEFITALVHITKYNKTLYVNGTWGWPMTPANKDRVLKNKVNQGATRKAKILAASADVFGFDCVGLAKGIFWGWNGDSSKQYGGAGYQLNGLMDINEASMIEMCNPTQDFSGIIPAGFVHKAGHIGYYIGDGLVVECTPSWKDGVQVTVLANISNRTDFPRRTWTRWGKFPLIQYQEDLQMTYAEFKEYMIRYQNELQQQPADPYAEEALKWAFSKGIIQGSGSGNLMPQSPVKREDLAVILGRYDLSQSSAVPTEAFGCPNEALLEA